MTFWGYHWRGPEFGIERKTTIGLYVVLARTLRSCQETENYWIIDYTKDNVTNVELFYGATSGKSSFFFPSRPRIWGSHWSRWWRWWIIILLSRSCNCCTLGGKGLLYQERLIDLILKVKTESFSGTGFRWLTYVHIHVPFYNEYWRPVLITLLTSIIAGFIRPYFDSPSLLPVLATKSTSSPSTPFSPPLTPEPPALVVYYWTIWTPPRHLP